jgi:ribose-phosphate pyrophosphokinase
MVKLLIEGKPVPFEITTFPDGTSQVWKLGDTSNFDEYAGDPEILWMFENEAEFMHVLQLSHLVQKELGVESLTLIAPYLPYGRQDKEVSSDKTFALSTFKNVLHNAGICSILTFDAHSKSDMVYENSIVAPLQSFHDYLFNLNAHDVICFPDTGASKRYLYSFNIDVVNHIVCEKERNQLTGEITGLKVLGTNDLAGRRILIVDDICDGGMTFIKVAQKLQEFNPKQIDLAVSHGLFSKGKQVLHDAGIKNIYTTNSLLRNPEGFEVIRNDYLR